MKPLISTILALSLAAAAPAAVTLQGVAAVTTIAVNAKTMAKWIRHPKRTARQAKQATKDAIKGKN